MPWDGMRCADMPQEMGSPVAHRNPSLECKPLRAGLVVPLLFPTSRSSCLVDWLPIAAVSEFLQGMLFLSISSLVGNVVIFTLWDLPSDGDHLWLAGIEHKAIAAVAPKKWCYYRVNFAGEPASLPELFGIWVENSKEFWGSVDWCHGDVISQPKRYSKIC